MAVEKSDDPFVVFSCHYGLVGARLKHRTKFEILWQARGKQAECLALSNKVTIALFLHSSSASLILYILNSWNSTYLWEHGKGW